MAAYSSMRPPTVPKLLQYMIKVFARSKARRSSASDLGAMVNCRRFGVSGVVKVAVATTLMVQRWHRARAVVVMEAMWMSYLERPQRAEDHIDGERAVDVYQRQTQQHEQTENKIFHPGRYKPHHKAVFELRLGLRLGLGFAFAVAVAFALEIGDWDPFVGFARWNCKETCARASLAHSHNPLLAGRLGSAMILVMFMGLTWISMVCLSSFPASSATLNTASYTSWSQNQES